MELSEGDRALKGPVAGLTAGSWPILFINVKGDAGMPGNGLNTLNQIALKVASLETLQEVNTRAIGDLAKNLNRLVEKLDQSDDIAKRALQGVESSQKQIDDIKSDIKSIRSGQRWMITTTVALVGLFLTAIGVLLKVIS